MHILPDSAYEFFCRCPTGPAVDSSPPTNIEGALDVPRFFSGNILETNQLLPPQTTNSSSVALQ